MKSRTYILKIKHFHCNLLIKNFFFLLFFFFIYIILNTHSTPHTKINYCGAHKIKSGTTVRRYGTECSSCCRLLFFLFLVSRPRAHNKENVQCFKSTISYWPIKCSTWHVHLYTMGAYWVRYMLCSSSWYGIQIQYKIKTTKKSILYV